MCSARNTYAECTKNTCADDTTADTDAWAAQLSGLVSNDDTWIGGKTHLVQLADTLDRGDGERHILVAYILVLVLLIYSCTTCAYTNTPERSKSGVGGAARKAVEDVSHAWCS